MLSFLNNALKIICMLHGERNQVLGLSQLSINLVCILWNFIASLVCIKFELFFSLISTTYNYAFFYFQNVLYCTQVDSELNVTKVLYYPPDPDGSEEYDRSLTRGETDMPVTGRITAQHTSLDVCYSHCFSQFHFSHYFVVLFMEKQDFSREKRRITATIRKETFCQ